MEKDIIIGSIVEKKSSTKQYVVLNSENVEVQLVPVINQDPLSVDYSKISLCKHSDINSCVCVLSQQQFSNLLRDFSKYTSSLFLESQTKNTRSFIPASGKTIGIEELHNMIDSSLDMWLTEGRFAKSFEQEFCSFLGVSHSLCVNSGSSANLIAVTALTSHKLGEQRLKEGDEIITLAAGFPTTIAPIIQNNLVPVFVDINLETYNIDCSQIEEAITERTKAIFIAHTLGNPFDIDSILSLCEKYNLYLIEDSCDALGSTYNKKYTGTFGHIGTFSFYPAHHITMGEGGAIVTDNEQLYKIMVSLRSWGRDCWCKPGSDNTRKRRFKDKYGLLPVGYDHKFVFSQLGYNMKITDWQASIGLAQLKKLPVFISKRKNNFNYLMEKLRILEDKLILPKSHKNSGPCWFGLILTTKPDVNKVKLVDFLEENGAGTRPLFAGNMLRHPAFLENTYSIRIRNSTVLKSNEIGEQHLTMLPNSDSIMHNSFWIGVWPGLSEMDLNKMIEILEKFCLCH